MSPPVELPFKGFRIFNTLSVLIFDMRAAVEVKHYASIFSSGLK